MGRQLGATPSTARKSKAMNKLEATESSARAEATPSAAGFDREQAVREAAYACFEARGCESGHELDDWLKAEAMVHEANERQERVRH